jgi:hypothetical protein
MHVPVQDGVFSGKCPARQRVPDGDPRKVHRRCGATGILAVAKEAVYCLSQCDASRHCSGAGSGAHGVASSSENHGNRVDCWLRWRTTRWRRPMILNNRCPRSFGGSGMVVVANSCNGRAMSSIVASLATLRGSVIRGWLSVRSSGAPVGLRGRAPGKLKGGYSLHFRELALVQHFFSSLNTPNTTRQLTHPPTEIPRALYYTRST